MDFDSLSNTEPSLASPRRMPAPWSVREVPGGYLVVDAAGRRLAYVYADKDQRGANNDTLTPDEARRVALNIAKLPGLLARLVPIPQGGQTMTGNRSQELELWADLRPRCRNEAT